MDTDIIFIIVGLVLTAAYVVLVAVSLRHEKEFLQSLEGDYKRGKEYLAQAA
jgi:hypothetical protein